MKVKKKVIVVISIFMLAFILYSGCIQKSKADAISRLDYSNRVFGFGLNIPVNWTLDENESCGNYAIFYCPQNETSNPVSLSINASQVNSSETLDSYFDLFIEESKINGKMSNYTLISRTDRTVSQIITYENIYTYAGLGDCVIKVKNLLMEPKEDVIICFQYTTPVSTYGTYEYDFEFSMFTLTFL